MEDKNQSNTPATKKAPTIIERKQAIANQLASNLASCSTSNRARLLDDADKALRAIDAEVMRTKLADSYKELATSCSGKWLFNFDTEEISQQIVEFTVTNVSSSGNHRNGFINGNGTVNMEVKNRTVACEKLNIALDGDTTEVALARAGYRFSKERTI